MHNPNADPCTSQLGVFSSVRSASMETVITDFAPAAAAFVESEAKPSQAVAKKRDGYLILVEDEDCSSGYKAFTLEKRTPAGAQIKKETGLQKEPGGRPGDSQRQQANRPSSECCTCGLPCFCCCQRYCG